MGSVPAMQPSPKSPPRRKDQVYLARLRGVVPKQPRLRRAVERLDLGAELLVGENLLEHIRGCRVGDFSPVCTHIDRRVFRKQGCRPAEHAVKKVAVFLAVLELPADGAAGAEGVRRAAEKPQPEPLVVV